MRRPAGIAGATLIYGPREQFPDMILALQFLLDDLRREGRQVSGVRLAGHSLRLRVEDFELAASLSPEPLPVTAFHGVMRPPRGGEAEGDWTHDLARGRLLHAIRHHRWALGVLLRARSGSDADDPEDELDLPAECRTVVAALVEASAPQFILWQGSGVLFTLAEFQTLAPPRLNAPGDPGSAMHPKAPGRPLARPAMPDWTQPTREPSEENASADAEDAAEDAEPTALPAIAAAHEAPRSRRDRMVTRSVGRMFRRKQDSSRPPDLPGIERSQRRLGRVFGRGRSQSEAGSTSPDSRMRIRRLRLLSGVLVAISLLLVFPPWSGV